MTTWTAFRTQLRVIFAIMMREARVRHGRSRLGYTWAVLEPVALIVFLMLIFREFRSGLMGGYDYALFFTTGVLPFNMFRSTSQYAAGAMDMNKPLFNYPPVQPVDAVIARVILEVLTLIAVMVLVIGVQMVFMDADPPRHPLFLMGMVGLIACFAFGTGMCLAAARERFPLLGHVYAVIMGPAFLLSGVFFSLHALPARARDILVWNPLIHLVEGFRTGYFPAYRAPELSLAYVGAFAIGTVFLGLALTLTFGKKKS